MKGRLIIGLFFFIGVTVNSQDSVYAVVDSVTFDRKASFKKGKLENYLAKGFRYPKSAVENSVQGYVILSFTITKNGTLEDITPLEFPNKELALNSIISLQSTDSLWNPTILMDKPIDHKYLIAYKYAIYLNETPPENLKKVTKYQEKKKYDKALKFCDKEINDSRYNSDAYLKRSIIKSELGDEVGSKEDLLKYQELRNQFIGNFDMTVIGITRQESF